MNPTTRPAKPITRHRSCTVEHTCNKESPGPCQPGSQLAQAASPAPRRVGASTTFDPLAADDQSRKNAAWQRR